MTFFGRLILVIGFCLAGTLLALGGTAYFVGEQVSEEIELARVSHLLGTLRQTTEANLSIGLQLDEISSLQPTIEREKADDPSIVVIDIFNGNGISIHSTDRGSIGEPVEGGWRSRLEHDGIWRTRMRGETVFGTRFENDLGVGGGIAVTVSGRGRAARSEVMSLDLVSRVAAIGTGAMVLGLALAFACAYALGRPFRKVADILRAPPGPLPDRPRAGLERLAVDVRTQWDEAEARITKGEKQLEALDDLG